MYRIVALGGSILSGENAENVKTVTFVDPMITTFEDDGPFMNCPNLYAFIIEGKSDTLAVINRVLFFKGTKSLAAYPIGKADTDYAVPNGIVKIEAYAFANSHVQNVTLPETMTELGAHAFENAASLSSVNLPDGIGEIPSFCFAGCTNLGEVSLGSGVKVVNAKAFYETHLTKIVLNDGLEEIGNSAFESTMLTEVTIPASVTKIGSTAFPKEASLIVVADTAAEKYAIENGYAYTIIGETTDDLDWLQ